MIDLPALEKRLRDIFEKNFEFLKAEGGHGINDYIKEQAFNQVLFYLRKNRELIEKISEAEVKLTLPGCIAPEEKLLYTIEGVIDIVQEGDKTWMYDLKTHDRTSIEGNKELYRQQLNVYAYIWKGLRQNHLTNTAVISTPLPNQLKYALRNGNPGYILRELEAWDPIVPLGYSEDEIETMIEEFGRTVEDIENKRFSAPPVQVLQQKNLGDKAAFAVHICRNCDARFSCPSFREYVRKTDSGRHGIRKYLDDYGTEFSTEEFIEGNIIEQNTLPLRLSIL